MSLGKAAVYKHIPVYYPEPRRRGRRRGRADRRPGRLRPADRLRRAERPDRRLDQLLHAAVPDRRASRWSGCTSRSAGWSARRVGPALDEAARTAGDAADPRPGAGRRAAPASPIADWRPEDADFWDDEGPRDRAAQPAGSRSRACCWPSRCGWCGRWWWPSCRRSASASPPTSCSGWRRCPGLSGATLRIFYSFMVPIFGGRLWTTLSTWSLLIPALGIGFAVQNPATPYWVFLAAGAAVRLRRRQLRLLDVQHLLLLPARRRRAMRWRSMPAWAISASASCSSWCRW